MEVKFTELTGLLPVLERIASALEGLSVSAGKAPMTHDSINTDPQPKKAEPLPQEPSAAPKKETPAAPSPEPELTEQTMRKFAAEAVKKGLKTAPQIIKDITGGITRFADIDASLYPQIHHAISQALEAM